MVILKGNLQYLYWVKCAHIWRDDVIRWTARCSGKGKKSSLATNYLVNLVLEQISFYKTKCIVFTNSNHSISLFHCIICLNILKNRKDKGQKFCWSNMCVRSLHFSRWRLSCRLWHLSGCKRFGNFSLHYNIVVLWYQQLAWENRGNSGTLTLTPPNTTAYPTE